MTSPMGICLCSVAGAAHLSSAVARWPGHVLVLELSGAGPSSVAVTGGRGGYVSSAKLGYLLERIDWRMPQQTWWALAALFNDLLDQRDSARGVGLSAQAEIEFG